MQLCFGLIFVVVHLAPASGSALHGLPNAEDPNGAKQSFPLGSLKRSCLQQFELGAACQSHFDCRGLAVCDYGTCVCPRGFVQSFLPADDPGYQASVCTMGPLLGEPCKFQKYCGPLLVCNESKLCDCAAGTEPGSGKFCYPALCGQGFKLAENGSCIPAFSELGQNCTKNDHCTTAYSKCIGGVCKCISGSVETDKICVPAPQCSIGSPLRAPDGSYVKCKVTFEFAGQSKFPFGRSQRNMSSLINFSPSVLRDSGSWEDKAPVHKPVSTEPQLSNLALAFKVIEKLFGSQAEPKKVESKSVVETVFPITFGEISPSTLRFLSALPPPCDFSTQQRADSISLRNRLRRRFRDINNTSRDDSSDDDDTAANATSATTSANTTAGTGRGGNLTGTTRSPSSGLNGNATGGRNASGVVVLRIIIKNLVDEAKRGRTVAGSNLTGAAGSTAAAGTPTPSAPGAKGTTSAGGDDGSSANATSAAGTTSGDDDDSAATTAAAGATTKGAAGKTTAAAAGSTAGSDDSDDAATTAAAGAQSTKASKGAATTAAAAGTTEGGDDAKDAVVDDGSGDDGSGDEGSGEEEPDGPGRHRRDIEMSEDDVGSLMREYGLLSGEQQLAARYFYLLLSQGSEVRPFVTRHFPTARSEEVLRALTNGLLSSGSNVETLLTNVYLGASEKSADTPRETETEIPTSAQARRILEELFVSRSLFQETFPGPLLSLRGSKRFAQSDTCAGSSFCSVSDGSSGEGYCCPKPDSIVKCPVGDILKNVSCDLRTLVSETPDGQPFCPVESHYCYEFSVQSYHSSVCCPRACPLSRPIFRENRCLAAASYGSACIADAQCSFLHEGARCERNFCLCPAGSRFDGRRCSPIRRIGESCSCVSDCPTGATCRAQECVCKLGMRSTDAQDSCQPEINCPRVFGAQVDTNRLILQSFDQGRPTSCNLALNASGSCQRDFFCHMYSAQEGLCCPIPDPSCPPGQAMQTDARGEPFACTRGDDCKRAHYCHDYWFRSPVDQRQPKVCCSLPKPVCPLLTKPTTSNVSQCHLASAVCPSGSFCNQFDAEFSVCCKSETLLGSQENNRAFHSVQALFGNLTAERLTSEIDMGEEDEVEEKRS